MKRIFLIIACIFNILFAEVASAEFTKEEQTYIDTRLIEIQEKIDTEGEKYRDFYVYVTSEELSNTKDTSKQEALEYILKEIQKTNVSQEKEGKEEILSEYNINLTKVKETWLSWQNKVRKELGLQEYVYNEFLNKSALKWSQTAKERGYIDHKRNSGDSYYDYNKIGNWMKSEGVVCKSVGRKTYSESIGYGVFSCKDDECSDELTNAIEGTFKMYLSEKGKKSTPHYGSIISPYFGIIGTGITVSKTGKNTYKYFITTHYCTELITK